MLIYYILKEYNFLCFSRLSEMFICQMTVNGADKTIAIKLYSPMTNVKGKYDNPIILVNSPYITVYL